MPPCNHRRKPGLGISHWGVAAPLVRPHSSGAASRPPSCGQFLGGPRPLPRRCSAQIRCVGGLLHVFPLRISALRFLLCAFCLVLFIFHFVFECVSAKHVFSNTSGTMSIVKACVKIMFISFVMDYNWRLEMVVCDRQQIPKLNLYSSRANR